MCQLSDNAAQVLSTSPALCPCLVNVNALPTSGQVCALFGISQISGYSFLAVEVMLSQIQLGAPGVHVQDLGGGGGSVQSREAP